jgi:hypothetical protein
MLLEPLCADPCVLHAAAGPSILCRAHCMPTTFTLLFSFEGKRYSASQASSWECTNSDTFLPHSHQHGLVQLADDKKQQGQQCYTQEATSCRATLSGRKNEPSMISLSNLDLRELRFWYDRKNTGSTSSFRTKRFEIRP